MSREIRTVLVAVRDPADSTQPVIERAADIASVLGAHVILFHAVFDSSLSGRPFFDSKRLARSRGWMVAQRTRQLERHAATLWRRNLATEVLVAWEEPAHEAIVRAAIRTDAHLVIAGPNHSPGWTLTDWELLRMCSRPLLLAQGTPMNARTAPILAALDPMHADDKPADLDVALAEYGALFAAALGVDFHAVHCIRPAADAPSDDTLARRERTHKRMESKMNKTLRRSGAAQAEIHVVHGLPETTVPELARDIGAQLMVMGAISRRGLKRLAIGNTAERVVYQSPCDLLIIKPDGFRPRLGRSLKQSLILPKNLGNSLA